MRLVFTKTMLAEAASCDFLPQEAAIKAAKQGHIRPMSLYMAHVTYRKIYQAYRKRGGLWMLLRRAFRRGVDKADAMTASWEILSNTAFTFEAPSG